MTQSCDYQNRLPAIQSGTGVPPVSFNHANNPATPRTKDALAAGNPTTNGRGSYNWDAENQLTALVPEAKGDK
jgi:hypothetical protein